MARRAAWRIQGGNSGGVVASIMFAPCGMKTEPNTIQPPQLQDGTVADLLQLFLSEGPNNFIPQIMTIMFNQAMIAERSHAIGAQLYQRTDERKGYANGTKHKSIRGQFGDIDLAVPKARGMKFYPQCIEQGRRCDRALAMAIATAYFKGVSTRKVSQIFETVFGVNVSSSDVSRCAAEMDNEFAVWRERPLELFIYLYLDARYENVRIDGVVRKVAVLSAIGVGPDGKRSLLGISVKISEAEIHWREFLAGLLKRGLHGVRLIVSDDHPGLKAAAGTVLPYAPLQRCQCHFQRNAYHHAPTAALREDTPKRLRAIFNAPDKDAAMRLLSSWTAELYQKNSYKEFASWLESNVPECLNVFAMPEDHRKKLRTTNPIERFNRELKRRTRVVCVFPNTESLLRLVTSVAVDTDDDWQSSRVPYMKTDIKKTN